MESEPIWLIFSIILFLITLPGTLELFFLTFGAVLSSKQIAKEEVKEFNGKLIVVVPAYNEETGIERTLASIKACHHIVDIVVIADNCTDNTANIAKNLGIRVIERNDLQKRGKNYALEFAFSVLLKEDYEFFMIIDADSLVQPNLIVETEQAFLEGAEVIQVRYGILDPYRNWYSRVMNIAFLSMHFIRPLGRQYWGLSSGLFGNGFALSKTVLLEIPYHVTSIVEDLAYHIELVKGGKKVVNLSTTAVNAEAPFSSKGIQTQRTRWEGGRFRLLIDQIPLLFHPIFQGNWRLIEPLLELLSFPLAYQATLLLILIISPIFLFKLYAFAGLGILFIHILAAIKMGGGGVQDLLSLTFLPYYLIKKLLTSGKIIHGIRGDFPWNRTDRNKNSENKDGYPK